MNDSTHLIWPLYDNSLFIDATELERVAEMMRADQYLFAHIRDGTQTHWRRQPEWVDERDFERQHLRSHFTWRVTLVHPS